MAENQKLLEAAEKSRQLPSRPSNEELLTLYSLYKQATEGDIQGDRPGGFDFKAIAKYDAWAKLKGMSQEDAEASYIKFVDDLVAKYSA
jgi:acyl-CoA-binding protein